MSLREQLLDLETRFWEAAGDPGFYREAFADDGLMALPTGIMTKDDVVAAMDGAEEWAGFIIEDASIVEVGAGVAALVYTADASRASSPDRYRALVISVYAEREGAWALVLHQQTPV